MTNEEKDLLLKDLCGRLPYGVRVAKGNIIYPLTGVNIALGYVELAVSERILIEEVRPYLRLMSSMTENEEQEIRNFFRKCIDDLHGKSNEEQFFLGFCQDAESLDYLNMHHLDYRGLIKKGLALEAPEGMYN